MTTTYARKARTMTEAELRYALEDVQATLAIWRDKPPTDKYPVKLWAEFDAYTNELQRLAKGKRR